MRLYATIILIACSFFAKAQTFTWTGYQHIADGATITVPINVSGLQPTIDNDFGVAHICLNITHSYLEDLTVKLQSPSGQVVTLIQNIGGSGNNFTGTCLGMDGVAFPVAQPPYTGIFFPAGDVSGFNNGQNPNGTWILTVTDASAPDTGSIHSAYIEFTNNPPVVNGTPGPPVGNYVFCPTCQCPGGADGCDLLPDMTSSYQEILFDHSEQPGVLYISNATPNIGSGPLDIFGIDSCFCNGVHVPCGTICPNGEQIQHVVKQRIYQKVPGTNNLTYYDRFAGKMTYHPTHGHLHVDNWANYTLRTATSNPDPRTWPIIASGTKQSFCLINLGNCASQPGECMDNNGNPVTVLPNSNLGWHNGCGLYQGIYPGNYDVYSQNLNDPMPLNNVCNGNYYIVSITDPDNNFLESDENNNWVAVPITLTQQNVTPFITPQSSTTFCQGGTVTLTSSPASNYLWSNGATTQSIVVSTAGTFTVSTNCGTSVTTSAPITTTLIPTNSAVDVSIALTTGSNPTCPGVFLTFNATPVNGGSTPTYQWKVNGANVGTNSPVYSTTTLTNGAVVTCTLTSAISCLAIPTVVSNSITMSVNSSTPVATIAQTVGTNPTCSGTSVTFKATLPTGDNPSYQWKVNGVNVGSNSNTYTTTTLTNGQVVRCDITYNSTCPAQGIIGTSTSVNDFRSNYGVAYPTYYGNGKQQYLIRASELTAQGVTAGKINALSFRLADGIGDPVTLNGYTIKIAQTALTTMSNIFQTPTWTTVFGPVNYTPVLNTQNRHQFASPFEWDGVSNLLVDICFANQVFGNAAYVNYQSLAPFLSTVYYQQDNQAGAGACVTTQVSGSGTMRPNMVFDVAERTTISSNNITMNVNAAGSIYTFTGSGNWNVAANWTNGIIPPSTLGPCGEIIIDPPAGQECILNVPQTVITGAKITVKLNKKFRVMGNLTVQ